jgi:hypothetical protein
MQELSKFDCAAVCGVLKKFAEAGKWPSIESLKRGLGVLPAASIIQLETIPSRPLSALPAGSEASIEIEYPADSEPKNAGIWIQEKKEALRAGGLEIRGESKFEGPVTERKFVNGNWIEQKRDQIKWHVLVRKTREELT